MSEHPPLRTENGNIFEDLSGISSNRTENPYDALIEICGTPTVCSAPLSLNQIDHRQRRSKPAMHYIGTQETLRKGKSSLAKILLE